MNSLMTIAIWNAGIASLLACVAYVVGRRARSAAVGHVLWILVLLKLVTPPVFEVPLHVLPATKHAVAAPSVANIAVATSVEKTSPVSSKVAASYPAPTFEETASSSSYSLLEVLFAIWLLGSVLYGTYQIYVTWQMCSLMKLAAPDNRIDRAMHRIAKRANVKNYPTARVVPWVGSPMLWGIGGTSVIVLPEQLFDSLSDEAADTLMQHELAHFQRGDQWVRILEVAASTFFWWHPVVWMAIHHIEIYEEQCCDAWVVQQDRSKRRSYAEALLDTVDFISDAPDTAMPIAASGLGRVPFLEQRLKAIMQGRRQSLTTMGRLGLLLLLASVPLQPKLLEASFFTSSNELDRSEPIANFPPLDRQTATRPDFLTHLKKPLDGKIADRAPVPEIEYSTAISAFGIYKLTAISGYRTRLEAVVSGQTSDLSSHQISCASFVPPKQDETPTQFAAGCIDGTVRLFDCVANRSVETIAKLDGAVHSVAYSQDGRLLAIGGVDGVVRLFDTDAKSTRQFKSTFGPIRCVRFSADGNWLAVVTDTWHSKDKGRVDIWDVRTEQHRTRITCPTAVGVAEFSDSGRILTAEWNGQLRTWSFNGEPISAIERPKDSISAAAFSPEAITLQTLVSLGLE